MAEKKFLFCGCGNNTEKDIKQAFKGTDIIVEFVPDAKLNLPAGSLLGLMPMPKSFPKQGGSIEMPLMLMYGISREEMEEALQILKRNGIRIPLKAMATETNIMWSISYLYGELKKEHEYMNSINRK